MGELDINLWLSARFDVRFYEIIFISVKLDDKQLLFSKIIIDIFLSVRTSNCLEQISNRYRTDVNTYNKVGTCMGEKLARTHKRAACDVLGVQTCFVHLKS